MFSQKGEPASSSHAGDSDEQDMNSTGAQVGTKRAAAKVEGASGIAVACRADHRQGVGVGAPNGACGAGAALRGGGASEERRDDVESGSDWAGVGGGAAIAESRACIGGRWRGTVRGGKCQAYVWGMRGTKETGQGGGA